MKKWIATTLVFGLPTFILGPIVWVSPAGSPQPTSLQLPFFIILGVFEAFSFGLGVSFLLFGYSLVKKFSGKDKTAAMLLYLAISWSLLNWWVHDGLHKINGENLQGLLYIEYAFHVTLIITAVGASYSFFRLLSKK